MAHGHSHGGGGHSHGSKAKKDRKKDEDALEAGDAEHLCAEEERAGHEDDHHGHSHSPTSIQTGYSQVNSNIHEDGDVPSKKKKKRGSKNVLRCTRTHTTLPAYLVDGGQMNIRGAFLHVLNDAVGSVVVIMAGLAMMKWPDKAWVNYVDPVASLLMISMIVVFTIPLRKCSWEEIPDADRLCFFSTRISVGSPSNSTDAHRSGESPEATSRRGTTISSFCSLLHSSIVQRLTRSQAFLPSTSSMSGNWVVRKSLPLLISVAAIWANTWSSLKGWKISSIAKTFIPPRFNRNSSMWVTPLINDRPLTHRSFSGRSCQ